MTYITDFLVALPGGALIFMSTLMFTTLLTRSGIQYPALEWLILAVDAFIVGLLAGMSRKTRALGTALASGVVAAGLLIYFWLAEGQHGLNPFIYGISGALTSLIFAMAGAWTWMRRKKKA